MRIVRAPVGLGFDASTYITPQQAAQFRAAGYLFRVGYLRRDQHVNEDPDLSDGPLSWPVSLSVRELHEHLDADLLMSFVQFARFHGRNYLSADEGARIGHNAAWNCRRLGVLEGATIWCDAEWTDSPPARLVIRFLARWAQAVAEAGYRPGCYVGFEGLTALQWYGLPYFRAYWRSAMRHMADPQPRGWCCYQGWEHSRVSDKRPPIFGASIDQDFSHYDNYGDRFYAVAG